MITQFQGQYRWLSNFAPVQIESGIYVYPSVEHAYMSEKCADDEWKLFCVETEKPGVVKKASYHQKLVSGWHDKKVKIMKGFLIQKFNQEPYKTKLLNTGSQHISEGNYWGDRFWGVDLKTKKGRNILGKLIMEIRGNLKPRETAPF